MPGNGSDSGPEKSKENESKEASAPADGQGGEAAGDVAGLTVDTLDTFALWARGRLSVSTGGSSDELLFEADPASGRLRAWGDVAVDGPLDVAGNVRARAFSTSGDVSGRRMEAEALSAADAALSRLDAESVIARGATIVTLAGERLEMLAALFERVASDEVSAGTLSVQGDVAASGAALASATIGLASVDKGSFGSFEAERAGIGELASRAVMAVEAATERLKASHVDVASVAAGRIEADAVSAPSVEADRLAVRAVSGVVAEIGRITAEAGEFSELSAGSLAAGGLRADDARMESVTSARGAFGSLSADELTAVAAQISDSSAERLVAESARVASLVVEEVSAAAIEAEEIFAGTLGAESASVDALSAKELDAGVASAGVLSAREFSAEAVTAGTVRAGEIQGTLSGLAVDGACAGEVVFPAIDEHGLGADEKRTVATPAEADAVLLTPCASGGPFVCAWEVEQLEPGLWEISRRFPADAHAAMEQGEFEPLEEASVYWLAVDYAR